MFLPLIGFVIATWLAGGPPPPDNQSVTVEQLRSLLVEAAHEKDAQAAHTVASQHLSERLSIDRLESIENELHPGQQTKEALRLLADSSAFLDPPASEIVTRGAPSVAEQQAMMNGAVHFVAVTLRRLPSFFATRTTRSFDDLPTIAARNGWMPEGLLHADGTFSEEITFRDGREVLGRKRAQKAAILSGLKSTGEFGPLQGVILRDVAHGALAWGHWESTAAGVVAVFQYSVSQSQSHYEVNYCCVRSFEDPLHYQGFAPGGIGDAYHGKPGYHGTLAIDPASGAITRLTLEALLRNSDPITDAGVAIDYGMVTIAGDKSYICPVRSIAISVTRSQMEGDFAPRTVRRINEVQFSEYHRFRATVKVVPSANP